MFDSVQLAKVKWWLSEPALISGLSNADLIQVAIIILALPLATQGKLLLQKLLPKEGLVEKIGPWRERFKSIMAPLLLLAILSMAHGVMLGLSGATLIIDITILLALAWLLIRLVQQLPITKELKRLITLALLGLVLLQFTNRLDAVVTFLDGARLTLGGTIISLWSIGKALLVLAILVWALKSGRKWVANYLRTTGTSPAARTLIDKALLTIGVAFGGLMTLSVMGINLTALTVFGGALGIGLGFGLRAITSNYISGILLLLDKSIKPGDVISVYDPAGHSSFGHVIQMNARYLVLRKRDGTEVLVPNERLMMNDVVNWSYNNKQVRQEVEIGVHYGSDMNQVKEVLTQAVLDTKRVLTVPAPRVFIKEFGDSSVVWLIRYWQNDPEEGVNNLKGDIYLAIWEALKANNIEIPYPQMVLHGAVKAK